MKKTKKRIPVHKSPAAFLKDPPPVVKRILRIAGSGTIGFLLSCARVIGDIRPFGIIPAAVLPSECSIWGALGCAFASLLFGSILDALKYTAAVAVISLLRLTAQPFFDKNNASLPQMLISAGSLLVCSTAVETARGITLAGFLLCVCESTLAGAGTFLLHNLFRLRENGYNAANAKQANVFILLACGLGILSLADCTPFGIPVSLIPAGVLILVSAYGGGETGGCLAGVCCGCIAGMHDDGGFTVISCCMGGLLSGLCIPAGRTAAALAYLLSCLLTMITNGVAGNPVLYTLASLAAGLIFILLPKKILQKATVLLCPFNTSAAENGTRQLLYRRLQTTQQAVREFAQTAAQVNTRIAKMKAPREEEIIHHVRSVCCADCPRQTLCWDHSLAGLRPVFLQAQQRLQADGTLTMTTLPDRLSAVCRKPEVLIGTFNDAYARFLQRSAQNKEIIAVKQLASSQLQTAAGILEDLIQSRTDGKALPALSQTVHKILTVEKIGFHEIFAEQDENGRIFIHIIFNQRPHRSLLQKAENLLTQKLSLSFASPVRSDEKGLHYCFYEMPAFGVRCDNAQHIGGHEQICGDSATCFRDEKGNFFAVLSDGMGTGERAALDSMMATSLAQTLLRAGMSIPCCADLVNAALLLRSRQETVATLDIAKIDLYTGKVNIYKAGACHSVLQSKGCATVIEQQSLPLGILEDTDLGSCEFTMHDGDCLYLLSDGASMLTGDFFGSLSDADTADRTQAVVQEALRCSPGNKADDITCLCIRLEKQDQNRSRKKADAPIKESDPVLIQN